MDFYPPPQIQQPDILGNYLRGVSAPGQLQAQQQGLTEGGLRIDQLRLALSNQQAYQDVAFQNLRGQGFLGGQPGPGGAQNQTSTSGGIQNGPQGSVSAQSPNFGGGAVGGFSPQTLGALAMLRGDDPLKTAQGVQEYQTKQAQLQASGPLDLIDTIFASDQPAKTVMNNPSLISQWPQFARQLGLDPVKDFNDQNVRRALAMAGNNLRGQVGMPAKDYPVPVQNRSLQYGEVGQFDPVTGKKVGDLAEARVPSFSLEDSWDPTTGRMVKKPVQTGGFGMAGTNTAGGVTAIGAPGRGGAPSASAAAQSPPGYDMGFKPPDDQQLKSAALAGDMRAGLQGLDTLERKGIILSPSARAVIVHAATADEAGLGSQLLSQEALSHTLSAPEQQYMAALMPVLQGAGHGMGGARLTTSQVRQLLESIVPVDTKNKAAMQQIRTNRQGYYNGMLAEAGSARELPLYKNTLAADYSAAAAGDHPADITALLNKYK